MYPKCILICTSNDPGCSAIVKGMLGCSRQNPMDTRYYLVDAKPLEATDHVPSFTQAHNALMLGVTGTALAAGANLLLSPHTHAMYSIAGALSADFQPLPTFFWLWIDQKCTIPIFFKKFSSKPRMIQFHCVLSLSQGQTSLDMLLACIFAMILSSSTCRCWWAP